jgi:hypothetical protein
MELKKGYTTSELSDFMQQTFREKNRARRTKDGGWEACAPQPVETPEVPTVPTVSTVSGVPEVPDPPVAPKGFWQRLRNRLRRRMPKRDNEKVDNS